MSGEELAGPMSFTLDDAIGSPVGQSFLDILGMCSTKWFFWVVVSVLLL